MRKHPAALSLLPSALLLLALLPSSAGISFARAPRADHFCSAQSEGMTTRVSVASDGTEGDYDSYDSSFSADGRYVAFASGASNLVTGDTNGHWDVFIHDRQTGQTARVSVASDGTEGDSFSRLPSLSADGRYVAFVSRASNLVAGDSNIYDDIFVHDRQTGQTARVSVASDGTEGDSFSSLPSLSADGRYVAFESCASNLVPGDTNGYWDIFVHDRQTGQTARVSVASDGTQGDGGSGLPSLSADGRYVAFSSDASNLVAGDTNGHWDVFVHDRQTGQTTRVSVASDGTQGDDDTGWTSLSADGRYVAFGSEASNLVAGDTNGDGDVFVHDRQMGQTARVSVASDGTQGDSVSRLPSLSADGRYVAFESSASNLVASDSNICEDIFVHDRQTGQTARVSVASDGTQGDSVSSLPSLSADGRYVAFDSHASNLVAGDTNGYMDIFVHDRDSAEPTHYLSLPFPHNPGDTGLNRLTAYFDHQYPLYDLEPSGATETLMRYDGATGNYAYSGHDGYDFGLTENTAVLAAAGGTITWSTTASHYCWVTRSSVKACIATIDHGNGYQTQYWHLVKQGGSNTNPVCRSGSAAVSAGDEIGQVGMTGCTTGPHLHFVVRHDPSRAFGTNTKVDPYFSFPHGTTDPWTQTFQDKNGTWRTGTASTWLWRFRSPSQLLVSPENGGHIATSWGLDIGIPPGAISNLAYVGAGIISDPDVPDIAAGANSRSVPIQASTTSVPVEPALRVTAVYTDGAPIPAFQVPVTVTVTYTDTDVIYVNEATLTIHQWDDSAAQWIALDTQLDLPNKTALAHLSSPSILTLRGQPLNSPPQVVAVDPISGWNQEYVQITVSGSSFLPGLSVDLGPYMSLNMELLSSTVLSATVPAGLVPGLYTLTIRNPDGQAAQLPDAYTVEGPPVFHRTYLPLLLRNH